TRLPGSRFLGAAAIASKKIRFHKRSQDGSGKCNIVAGNGSIHVALYEIGGQEKALLDRIEGVGSGYCVETIEAPGFGECFTYVAVPSYIDNMLRPYSWYKELVLVGCEALEFPIDYIAMIRDGDKILDGSMGEVKAQFGKNSVQIVYSGNTTTINNHAAVESVLEFPNYLEAKLKDGADHMSLLRDLSQSASISRFEKVEPSLYSIFLEVARIDPAAAESSEISGKTVNV
ncbi:MAG: DUF4162 domain-containing protein, partial [candidate division Zixibacteria bacterium]|nr:DUF4162 domain-containing protein [candidate division Zixibacteria bacterium]